MPLLSLKSIVIYIYIYIYIYICSIRSVLRSCLCVTEILSILSVSLILAQTPIACWFGYHNIHFT